MRPICPQAWLNGVRKFLVRSHSFPLGVNQSAAHSPTARPMPHTCPKSAETFGRQACIAIEQQDGRRRCDRNGLITGHAESPISGIRNGHDLGKGLPERFTTSVVGGVLNDHQLKSRRRHALENGGDTPQEQISGIVAHDHDCKLGGGGSMAQKILHPSVSVNLAKRPLLTYISETFRNASEHL